MAEKIVPLSPEKVPVVEREPIREAMRPAYGLLVGLALSAIIWLSILIFWLAA